MTVSRVTSVAAGVCAVGLATATLMAQAVDNQTRARLAGTRSAGHCCSRWRWRRCGRAIRSISGSSACPAPIRPCRTLRWATSILKTGRWRHFNPVGAVRQTGRMASILDLTVQPTSKQ